MSEDIVWGIVRKDSSYLIRRGGHAFEKHPLNNTGLNSKTRSAIAKAKVLGIEQDKNGKLTLKLKGTKGVRFPAKNTKTVALTRDNKKNLKKIDGLCLRKKVDKSTRADALRSYNTLFKAKSKTFYRTKKSRRS